MLILICVNVICTTINVCSTLIYLYYLPLWKQCGALPSEDSVRISLSQSALAWAHLCWCLAALERVHPSEQPNSMILPNAWHRLAPQKHFDGRFSLQNLKTYPFLQLFRISDSVHGFVAENCSWQDNQTLIAASKHCKMGKKTVQKVHSDATWSCHCIASWRCIRSKTEESRSTWMGVGLWWNRRAASITSPDCRTIAEMEDFKKE